MHRLPEVIGIEVSRKLVINVHHVDIALLIVSNHGLVVIPCAIHLEIYAKRSIYLQLESRKRSMSALLHRPTNFVEWLAYIVGSLTSLLALVASSPSTPWTSNSCSRPLSLSTSCCNLSPSISRSEAALAMRNFCVSSSTIWDAWSVLA